MMLVNAILNTATCPSSRDDCRRLMKEAGLGFVLETGTRNKEICRQIEEYYADVKDGQQQERVEPGNYRKKPSSAHRSRNRIFKSLVDPYYVFQLVLDSIEGSVCYDHFLSMLQNILVYSNNLSNDTERTGYFRCIDSYIDRQNKVLTCDGIPNTICNHGSIVEEQSKKIESLEDLLRMSRHTIDTLQKKLQEIQTEYETNLSALEQQLNVFYKAVEQDDGRNNDSAIFTSSEQDFGKPYTRTMAKANSSKTCGKENAGIQVSIAFIAC